MTDSSACRLGSALGISDYLARSESSQNSTGFRESVAFSAESNQVSNGYNTYRKKRERTRSRYFNSAAKVFNVFVLPFTSQPEKSMIFFK
jgi:hypothetical protein